MQNEIIILKYFAVQHFFLFSMFRAPLANFPYVVQYYSMIGTYTYGMISTMFFVHFLKFKILFVVSPEICFFENLSWDQIRDLSWLNWAGQLSWPAELVT